MSTEYVVLRKKDEGWAEMQSGPYTASNDQQAIREATKKLTAEARAGTFVAVPTRSFRPRTRAVETKEVDRWT